MNARIYETLIDAALNDAPPCLYERRAADWIGRGDQWQVLSWLKGGEEFYRQDEEHQRWFLLFIAATCAPTPATKP